MMQIVTWFNRQGEEPISIIRSLRHEGHPTNKNEQNCHMHGILTTGDRPTLPQCGKDGVVLYGLTFIVAFFNV